MLSKNQIKELQSLQLKKFRDAQRLFIAEGIKTVSEIIHHQPEALQEVFATSDFIKVNEALLRRLQIKFTEITETELEKISLQQSPNQALAVCQYFTKQKVNPDLKHHFSLFLDDVRDPGNFGTIMRLADWFGISTIFCSPNSCDVYNPKVIQATMGSFLRVNMVYDELENVKASLGIETVYGAVLNGKNLYRETLGNGLIIIGNEANGITEKNLALITHPITIPSHQANSTESLNAAVATSIIVSEFFRQLKDARS